MASGQDAEDAGFTNPLMGLQRGTATSGESWAVSTKQSVQVERSKRPPSCGWASSNRVTARGAKREVSPEEEEFSPKAARIWGLAAAAGS